jgi:hypothetical protein
MMDENLGSGLDCMAAFVAALAIGISVWRAPRIHGASLPHSLPDDPDVDEWESLARNGLLDGQLVGRVDLHHRSDNW